MQPEQLLFSTQNVKEENFIFPELSKPQEKRPQQSSQDIVELEEEQTQPQKPQNSQKPEEYQPLQGYVISKTLGKGNFGKVKLALHKLTQQHVAVKILQKDLIFQNTDIVRITRQLKIMKRLRHPFVVQLYEIIETPKQLYLIMEYAEGGDLFDKIVNEEKIKENQAAAIFTQIALGMEYFHSKGVTHRDLKPENILLSKDGTIKIADFGLGNMFKPDDKLKTACGSPCYASPQMLNRQAYDPKKVDIWSAGIILYALVCGYLPFEDQVTSKLYEKIKTTNVKLPSWVSSPCRNLIRGLLTKDPKLRFDIQSILSHQIIAPHAQKYRELVKQRQLTENKIEQICEKYDIEEREKLVSDLNKNRHNNLTTLYYLAVRRIERLEEDYDQDEDEEQFLRMENQKVKQRGKQKEKEEVTSKMEERVEQIKNTQENMKDLTGIQYEEREFINAEKETDSYKIEEEVVDVKKPEQDMQAQQNLLQEKPYDEIEQKVSEQIVGSAQKSLNSERQLSDDELQIHNLHQEMRTEFETATQVPVFGQQEEHVIQKEQDMEEKVRNEEHNKEVQQEHEEILSNEKLKLDENMDKQEEYKTEKGEPIVLESIILENQTVMDEQKPDQSKIIEQSYLLSMQIENTLAQLNQLAQLQQEHQEIQQQEKQKEEISYQKQGNQSQIDQNTIQNITPSSTTDQPQISQLQVQNQTVEERFSQLQEKHSISTNNQITQQLTQIQPQYQHPKAVKTQKQQLLPDHKEPIDIQPSYLQTDQQEQTQVSDINQPVAVKQSNTQPEKDVVLNPLSEISPQLKEQKQSPHNAGKSSDVHQLQQPFEESKNQPNPSLDIEPPELSGHKYPSQLFEKSSNPLVFPQQNFSNDKPQQLQQLHLNPSHLQEVQNPKTPPKPISPTKTSINLQKKKPKPSIKQESKQSPKIKQPESKPQPKQLQKPKLARQHPNRHSLFSNDKTLSQPSKEEQPPNEIKPLSNPNQQEKPKINSKPKPANRNIRFNERSQSRDSPVVFKSNKNSNQLLEKLKNKNPNQSTSKEKPEQKSPRINQLSSKLSSKDAKLKSSLEKDNTINSGRQKITIAKEKEKTAPVRQKFQIAKKIEPNNKNKTLISKNKSIEKFQKSQKIINEFKQIPESIHQEPEKSLEKIPEKFNKPKVNPLMTNSNKKTQKNFSDRFRKNIEDKKHDLTSNVYEEVSISPVSGYYSKQKVREGKKEKSDISMQDEANVQNETGERYIQRQKQTKPSTIIVNQPKNRTKLTISQYSSTTNNKKSSIPSVYLQKTAKSSTSIAILSPKYHQPQSKYSNIYQHKTSHNKNSPNLNNTISSFGGSYGSRKSSGRVNTASYGMDANQEFRDGSSMSSSNTKKFEKIELDQLNSNTLSIQFVQNQPTLLNPELLIFVSIQQLYQIVEGLSNSLQNSLNIQGTLTIYQYPTKDYLYILKSDLSKSSETPPSNKLASSQYTKTLNLSQNSPTGFKNKFQISSRTKISTFQFVELINSIVHDEENQ